MTAVGVNGCSTAYVKPQPPQIGTSGLGILGNNASPPRPAAWNRNVPPDKLSFTMRREFEKAKEEAELIQQLRTVRQYASVGCNVVTMFCLVLSVLVS